jgi:hypothetical protein
VNVLRAFPISRIFQSLATLAAMALFAWIAAHWIWRALEPAAPPPAMATTSEGDLASRITGGSAFGFARGGGAQAGAEAATQAQLDARIRLLGIAREPGRRGQSAGQALFKIDRRILWLSAGDELDPGIKLSAIDADGVRLSANGREVRMPLRVERPAAKPGGVAPASGGAQPAAAAPAAAIAGVAPPAAPAGTRAADGCRLALEQRSRAYVLRPEIVDSVMRERSSWADLFKAGPTGLVVQNPGGTGAMLGLYANDVLSKADGAQLAGTDDVLRLVLQPLARNDSVVVTGSRAGQPREWIYAGMSCINR